MENIFIDVGFVFEGLFLVSRVVGLWVSCCRVWLILEVEVEVEVDDESKEMGGC